jgi:chemotaxis protein histidine kinase CheA
MTEEFKQIFLQELEDALSLLSACASDESVKASEFHATLYRIAHNLKGSSASVGLSQLSSALHKIEDRLVSWKGSSRRFPNAGDREFLIDVIDHLEGWAEGCRMHVVSDLSPEASALFTGGASGTSASSDGSSASPEVVALTQAEPGDIVFNTDLLPPSAPSTGVDSAPQGAETHAKPTDSATQRSIRVDEDSLCQIEA